MKKIIILIILLPGLWSLIFAQHGSNKSTIKNNAKKRLIILPAKIDNTNNYTVENEATRQIVNAATQLGRFKVIDRYGIMGVQLLQQDGIILDSMVVKLGVNISAHSALVVSVLNFGQQGVPPDLGNETQEAILELAVELLNDEDEEDEKYASNVRTELVLQVDKIDIKTGKTTKFFTVHAVHTGGNRDKSRAKVMEQVKKEAMINLANLANTK